VALLGGQPVFIKGWGADNTPSTERKNRWRARIMVDGKSILIGDYININDAIFDRKLAEKKHGFHKNHGS